MLGMISLKASRVGMYGSCVLQDAVCVSSNLSESYSKIAAAAMDMFFVYATSMPATCLIFLGSWSSRMRSLDIRCCARWGYSH